MNFVAFIDGTVNVSVVFVVIGNAELASGNYDEETKHNIIMVLTKKWFEYANTIVKKTQNKYGEGKWGCKSTNIAKKRL